MWCWLAGCAGPRDLVIAEDQPPQTPDSSTVPAETPAEADRSDLPPTDPEVLYNVLAGELLGRDGQVMEAINHYLEAAFNSDDPEVAKRVTQLAMRANSWQQAVMGADRWTVLAPQDPDAWRASVIAGLQVGDFAGATDDASALYELLSEQPGEAWRQLAELLARSPSSENATDMLHELIEKHGDVDDADALLAQSQLAVRLGDADLATDLARQAIEKSPQRADLLIWAGQLALNDDDREAALGFYRSAYELDTSARDIALAYAELLHRTDQTLQAQAVLAQLPESAPVVFTRVVYSLDAGLDEGAAALFERLKQLDDEDPSNHAYLTAQAAELLGRPEEAIGWYQQVEEGERWMNSRLRRAILLADAEGIEAARDALSELKTDSRASVVEQGYLAESQLFQRHGDLVAATEALTLGLTKVGQSAPLRYARGLVLAARKEVELAEEDFISILNQEPDNADTLNAYGYTLADLTDRHEEALNYIQRALVLKPNDPAIIDSMGWVLYRLGRLDEARRYLEQALSMADNAEIAAHLGEVLWKQGEQDSALEVFRTAHESDPEHPVLTETIKRLNVPL